MSVYSFTLSYHALCFPYAFIINTHSSSTSQVIKQFISIYLYYYHSLFQFTKTQTSFHYYPIRPLYIFSSLSLFNSFSLSCMKIHPHTHYSSSSHYQIMQIIPTNIYQTWSNHKTQLTNFCHVFQQCYYLNMSQFLHHFRSNVILIEKPIYKNLFNT